jgi:hypothetical protein
MHLSDWISNNTTEKKMGESRTVSTDVTPVKNSVCHHQQAQLVYTCITYTIYKQNVQRRALISIPHTTTANAVKRLARLSDQGHKEINVCLS